MVSQDIRVKIPFIEQIAAVQSIAPGAIVQEIAPAPYVFVFDSRWLQETFWPYWGDVKRELDAAISARPMTNNARRGSCDEITKRFVAELTLSCRIANGDDDVAPGVLEATVSIPQGYTLNRVRDGWHRAALLCVTDNQKDFRLVFVEPQLGYAQFQTTYLDDAIARGVVLRECWL